MANDFYGFTKSQSFLAVLIPKNLAMLSSFKKSISDVMQSTVQFIALPIKSNAIKEISIDAQRN